MDPIATNWTGRKRNKKCQAFYKQLLLFSDASAENHMETLIHFFLHPFQRYNGISNNSRWKTAYVTPALYIFISSTRFFFSQCACYFFFVYVCARLCNTHWIWNCICVHIFLITFLMSFKRAACFFLFKCMLMFSNIRSSYWR